MIAAFGCIDLSPVLIVGAMAISPDLRPISVLVATQTSPP